MVAGIFVLCRCKCHEIRMIVLNNSCDMRQADSEMSRDSAKARKRLDTSQQGDTPRWNKPIHFLEGNAEVYGNWRADETYEHGW